MTISGGTDMMPSTSDAPEISKIDSSFISADGITPIHTAVWVPQGAPRAILQISHGMTEYIERYSEFAEFCATHGILVVGNDHLAHGASVATQDDWGKLEPGIGRDQMIEDMHTLRRRTSETYGELPYFMLGHSMGSFLVRGYITRYHEDLTGGILSGTGSQPTFMLKVGKWLTSRIARSKGWDYRSPLVKRIVSGSNNKRIKPRRTESDWLTTDEAIVDAYVADPRCTFTFALGAYHELFSMIELCQDKERIEKIEPVFPLLLISGKEDPIGNYGLGVIETAKLYQPQFEDHVEVTLYEGGRHEVLNEMNRINVYHDVVAWIDAVLSDE